MPVLRKLLIVGKPAAKSYYEFKATNSEETSDIRDSVGMYIKDFYT